MSIGFGDGSSGPATAARQLREQRSGLSGLGGRPALHPAWKAPFDSDPPRSDAGGDCGLEAGGGARG